MANECQMSRGDALFSGYPTWAYASAQTQLSHVIQSVRLSSTSDLTQVHTHTSGEKVPVYLVQQEESTPCLISLQRLPECKDLITSLLVVSEARTMEVYSAAGEYCGTCRGEPDADLHLGGGEERSSFFQKHLILECPSTSCEVKLLSLGGRTRVGVSQIMLGLRTAELEEGCPPTPGQGIDLRRVQSMVGSMGASLSPGAQSLMDLVQFQQQSKMDVLGGFLPLLMGGGSLASLARRATESQGGRGAVVHTGSPELADGAVQEAPSGPKPQMGSGPQSEEPRLPDGGFKGPHLAGAVSSLMNGHLGQNPDLFPVLQTVCGQVARLQVEDDAEHGSVSRGPRQEHSCCQALQQLMEKQLQEMERRLTQHIDQRLDALQQGLERTLLAALHTAALPNGPKDITSGGCHCSLGLLNGES